MKQVFVLGCGMIGQTVVRDLSRCASIDQFEVTVADSRQASLDQIKEKNVKKVLLDLSRPDNIKSLVSGADLVVGALSSAIGLGALRAVIESGAKAYVDIAFMAENALEEEHDKLARSKGICCIVDVGVCPGISNVAIGWAVKRLGGEVEDIDILVGGLPESPVAPHFYKAPFAPSDVIEEYVRPSRVVENGRIVLKEALSEPELIGFAGVGVLEAFNTDGLRSLAYTMKSVPNMRERTLRYPGHRAAMAALKDMGLFSDAPVALPDGRSVTPRELTSALLFKEWAYLPGEPDLTVMRVTVSGNEKVNKKKIVIDLLDRYDPATATRSMSRTTGYSASVMALLVLRGLYHVPGVHGPEDVGGGVPGAWEMFQKELNERGVKVTISE
jgi:lysine 6-dehydrogenase